MLGIDRAGMKVECIEDCDAWAAFCCAVSRWPRVGGVYVVSAFGDIEGIPGIYLHELSSITCQCHGLSNAPWPLEIFRPLDQRRTDISALTKLLDKVPELA